MARGKPSAVIRRSCPWGARTSAYYARPLAIVVAAIIALHLFHPTNWPALGLDILHSLHGPGFAAAALAILWYLQKRNSSNLNYVLAAATTMGIGIISEIAQIPGPRDAQFGDLLVDALGIAGALGVTASFDRTVRAAITAPARFLLPVAAGTALAIACVPTLWFSYALIEQQRAFPALLTFEHAWEKAAFGQTASRRPDVVDAPADWPITGRKVAHAIEDGRWGIFLSLYPVQDWRGHSQLRFTVASIGERFRMDIGIREVRQDQLTEPNRFYTNFWAEPEARTVTITFAQIQAAMKDRPFDFSHIESVVFSAVKPGSGQEVLLDDIRLEGRP